MSRLGGWFEGEENYIDLARQRQYPGRTLLHGQHGAISIWNDPILGTTQFTNAVGTYNLGAIYDTGIILLGENGTAFVQNLQSGLLKAFSASTGAPEWDWDFPTSAQMKLATDNNTVIVSSGDGVFEIGVGPSGFGLQPRSILAGNPRFDMNFVIGGQTDSFGITKADKLVGASTGMNAPRGHLERNIKTPPDNPRDLLLTPQSDCYPTPSQTGRTIFYQLQRRDGTLPKGKYFVTEQVSDPSVVCGGTTNGKSTDFGGWLRFWNPPVVENVGSGNEYFDRIGQLVGGGTGRLTQYFTVWESKYAADGPLNSCTTPRPAEWSIVDIFYPAAGTRAARAFAIQEVWFDAPVRVRGVGPRPESEWVTQHNNFCKEEFRQLW
jgi:hypothetical protein